VPVVAFDVSGTSEVVRDGETGLLVKNGDVAEFSRKLGTLIRDDELRKRLGEQAALFGRGYFVSWDERIEMECRVLERLAGRR
jgi:glycosyltransferase involved in cell wall biosynthesis